MYPSFVSLISLRDKVFYSNRSAAYANLRNYKEALADAEKTIQLNPSWAKGYSRKGVAAFFLGMYDEALAAYKKGLEIEPGNDALKAGYEQALKRAQSLEANILGEQHLAKSKPHDAIKAFDTAISLEPNDALFYSNRSDANLRCGFVDNALKDAEKTISLRPNWFKGYARKADALMRLERHDEAASMYAAALQQDPSNTKVRTDMNNAVQEGVRSRARKNMEAQQEQQKDQQK